MKKILFAVTLIAAFSVFAMGRDIQLTARTASKGAVGHSTISLSAPHACGVSKAHPCVYYGGDFNSSDPNANGYANENTLDVPDTYTYNEVNSPVGASLSAAFSNNQSTNDTLDPMTGTWDFRSGVSEGNGGTSLGSGDNPAEFTFTGRIAYGVYNEYEVLTTTPVKVAKGDVWFTVLPNCTNANDANCSAEFWGSTTDGTLNAINGKYTITSNTGMGPTFNSSYFGYTYASWCNDLGLCGDGMSYGVLR